MTFNLPARTFVTGDHLVSTSVFHWFSSSGGQLSGPWRPVEGRQNWTGQPDFWVRQIKDIMDANIDVMYVHLIPAWEQERVNLFEAMRQLREQGYEVPKAVPFLDADITWYGQTFPDVATSAGKDQWVAQYIRYFNQFFSRNTDPQADGYLGIMNGRVMLDTWHMINVINHASLTRSDVETRLASQFGVAHPIFTNGVYQIATAVGSYYPAWCDELVYQFCTNDYLMRWSGSPQIRTYTVKGGYWDQNIRDPGFFLARDGGTHYIAAWQSLLGDSSPYPRVYIESWNEYDEGSGIYAADPGPPYIDPFNQSGNTDVWSNTSNPREYIDTTASYAGQFNGRPQRAARILGHSVPASLFPGESVTATIVVRNEGNAQWTNAGNYRLGQLGPVLYEWSFDSGQDGWVLVRNAFGTSGNTAYENGQWAGDYGLAGGGLRTRTGNVDGVDYFSGASTAFARTIHLDTPRTVLISFKWRLFCPSALDSPEQGEARFEVDNQAYGISGNYLAHFSGGVSYDQDSGWRDYSVVLTLSGSADHTLEIGGWNNRKTDADEFVDVYVDDVAILDVSAVSPLAPARVLLDDAQDEVPIYGGIFRGRPKSFTVPLTAPYALGNYDLHFQMLQENVAWFGQRLDLQVQVVIAGDFDQDHDVDQEDFGRFQACLSGSGITYAPGCENADMQRDGDVDQYDLAIFHGCMSGANMPADLHCAD